MISVKLTHYTLKIHSRSSRRLILLILCICLLPGCFKTRLTDEERFKPKDPDSSPPAENSNVASEADSKEVKTPTPPSLTESEFPNGPVRAALQRADGKWLIGGNFSKPGFILQMKEDGSLDAAFSAQIGGGFNAPVLALALQSDGKILVGGEFTDFNGMLVGKLVRLNADGSLDEGFAQKMGTGFNHRVTSLAIQKSGQILAGGSFTSFNGQPTTRLARLEQTGALDTLFGQPSGKFPSPEPSLTEISSEPSPEPTPSASVLPPEDSDESGENEDDDKDPKKKKKKKRKHPEKKLEGQQDKGKER